LFEPLESRLLLSADLGVEAAPAAGRMQADYGAVVEGAFDAQAVNGDDPAHADGVAALLATTQGAGGQPALSASAIAAIESEAIARWEASGLIDVSVLDDVRFALVDLPGRALGLAVGRTILLDRDAAGHGWFVDPTPADDEEFAAGQVVEVLLAPAGSPAFGRIDLITALGHELGHMAGQDHDGLAVMRVSLAVNERVADFTAEAFAPPEPPPLIKSEHGTVVHYFDHELAVLRRVPAPQLNEIAPVFNNEIAPVFYYERASASLLAADETATRNTAEKKGQIDWHGGLKSAAKSAAFETLQKLKAGPNASIRLR
jgi:hypothetical protein